MHKGTTMFEIQGIGGSSASSLAIYDQTPLIKHLENIGIGLEDLNFFEWNAFPKKSYGKFLVWEKQWKEVVGGSTNGSVNLVIEVRNSVDETVSTYFNNLEVVSTSFIQSPNQKTTQTVPPTNPDDPPQEVNGGQDGERMVIVELEHTDMKYHDSYRIYEAHDSFDSLLEMFDNGQMLKPPQVFNNHTIPDMPIREYLAYVASSNFLTVYLPKTGGLPKLTNDMFQYPLNNPMLYNKVSILAYAPEIKLVLQDDRLCNWGFHKSKIAVLNLEETYFYKTSVNSTTIREKIDVLIPYAKFDNRLLEFDPDAGEKEADTFVTKIKYYMEKRLLRNVDIIYQGLVLGSLSNDVQSIRYYFSGYDNTFRTRLRTVPWNAGNYILAPREVACKDVLMRATLLADMTEGANSNTGTAVITKILSKQFLIDREAVINDPLKLLTGMKKGQRAYVYQECGSCEYVAIQGECPPTSVTPNQPNGKCCVEFQIEYDASRTYCYVTTKKVCDALGGTWTEGGYCPTPLPYCEEEE